MNSFEEEFPSLKDKQYCADGYDSPCILSTMKKFYPHVDKGDWLQLEDVQKHCLDKQKVRGALDEVRQELNMACYNKSVNNRVGGVWAKLFFAYKQLGLDEE